MLTKHSLKICLIMCHNCCGNVTLQCKRQHYNDMKLSLQNDVSLTLEYYVIDTKWYVS